MQLELLCTGRQVDLVEERFDVGIRAGVLADSSLVARSLGSVTWFLVATGGYLKRRRHGCLHAAASAGIGIALLPAYAS